MAQIYSLLSCFQSHQKQKGPPEGGPFELLIELPLKASHLGQAEAKKLAIENWPGSYVRT